jgi:HlyD family secretion protein
LTLAEECDSVSHLARSEWRAAPAEAARVRGLRRETDGFRAGKDHAVKGLRLWALMLAGWAVAASSPARADFERTVSCLGEVVPGERVIRMAAPVGAIVGELRVERGARVEKGDVVAVLRDAVVHEAHAARASQQVALARAELDLVRAGERRELVEAQQSLIAAHQAEASLLERRLARYDTLVEAKHVSKDEYEDMATQLESLRAKIRREQSLLESFRSSRAEVVAKAEISVRLAEAQAAEAEAALELQRIRAPFAGEILDIHAWPGESVGADGEIASLADLDHMMVLAEVYESDLPRLKVGDRAFFRGRAFEGEFAGTVVEIHKWIEGSRIFALEPSAYVDRRIAGVRIRPDDPAALQAFSHAQVTVTLRAP